MNLCDSKIQSIHCFCVLDFVAQIVNEGHKIIWR